MNIGEANAVNVLLSYVVSHNDCEAHDEETMEKVLDAGMLLAEKANKALHAGYTTRSFAIEWQKGRRRT